MGITIQFEHNMWQLHNISISFVFTVPSPVVYAQLNPVQFKLDYTSVLWLNQFASNLLQTLVSLCYLVTNLSLS